MFTKYPRIEKLGSEEIEGILDGTCQVFPKIDGTNASVWLSDLGELQAGSRNRVLSLENDNANFYYNIKKDEKVIKFLKENPKFTLFGEWLVPHSLKTYVDHSWNKFFVFDVYDRHSKKFLDYSVYANLLNKYEIEYIPSIASIKNPSEENLYHYLNKNTYLIKDGKGVGEGVVIKNYNFTNKYGRTTWLKLITNSFKAKHLKEMGEQKYENKSVVEQQIVDQFIDKHLIEKEYAKIRVANNRFSSRDIPQFLHTVYYCLITECIWDILKKYRNPKIDFTKLQRLAYIKVKELKPEVF